VLFSSSASIAAATAGTGPANVGPYGVAKAGVLGLTWGAAVELRQYGITANAIFPGAATRMIDRGLPDDERGAALRSERAVGTWRDPTHVAPVIAYLLSDEGANVNGQIFGAAGGRLAHYRPIEPRKVIQAAEGVGFSIDELFGRFRSELGEDLDYFPAPYPPPVGEF
jgi:hypothetical protein